MGWLFSYIGGRQIKDNRQIKDKRRDSVHGFVISNGTDQFNAPIIKVCEQAGVGG